MKHLSGAPLKGRPLALPANIRLGWKSLPGTNTLAYYENQINYGRNKFYSAGPCGLYYKTITIVIMMIVSDATIWSITYDYN